MRITTQALLLVLALVGGLYLLYGNDADEPDLETAERQQTLPKSYLENIRTWIYDDAGRLTEVLDAGKARYFESADETLLDSPKLFSHHAEDRTWSASAARGRIHTEGEVLDLEQNVVLISDQSGGRLETEAMVVELDRKIALSDELVTIVQGENTTHADGMVADLELERIELKPNVESVYVQAQP
ncbi:MAG: LPS export ABC transporter periplasmic protein LptC [Pseudomonadota bacterium]